MNGFIKHFMALAGVLSIVFGAYIYLTEKPSALIGEQKRDLEAQIDKVEATIRAEMKDRNEARDKELQDLRSMITSAKSEILQKLDKVDDRLYDMQRKQNESAYAQWGNPDGG